jgi:hypothetical protein
MKLDLPFLFFAIFVILGKDYKFFRKNLFTEWLYAVVF